MTDVSKYKWGALPSPRDDRDYQFSNIIVGLGELPKQYQNPYLEKLNNIILDQGDTMECVCCSVAHMKWLIERQQNGNKDMFSPSYLYGNHSWDDAPEGGCYPRCVCAQHTKFGICKLEDFPKWYTAKPIANRDYKKQKAELDPKAYPYRSNSYYACGLSLDGIKRAIMLRGAVMLNCPVHSTLMDMVTPFTAAPTSNTIYGYHAMTAVGWDDEREAWIVVNSYGKTYDDINLGAAKKNGYFYLDYNYPIIETWTFVDDINEVRKDEAEMFKDIEGHWAQKSLEKAVEKGVLNGYEDGTMRPDDVVTRAELATILDRIGVLD